MKDIDNTTNEYNSVEEEQYVEDKWVIVDSSFKRNDYHKLNVNKEDCTCYQSGKTG